MKTRLLSCLSLVGFTAPTFAVTLISDSFGTADHPTADPTSGVSPAASFILPSSNVGAATITNDATFSSDVLSLKDTDGSGSTATVAIASLPSIAQLSATGSQITLNASFRFTTTTGTPTLRFGFYNSNSTSPTGTGSDNDTGYYVNLTAPSVITTNLFYRETGTNTGIMGGSDRANFTASAATPTLDTTLHTLAFSLTRTNATTISFSLSLDGAAAITTTTTSTLLTSFDEFALSTGFNNVTGGTGVLIDDLVVTATDVIPEPSSLAFLPLAGIPLLRRRRK